MIGRTNAGKGADNPIIVENVSDIDKLLVKDNVGKVFKYVGETFYPQGQATPIVASQPFEKLYIDTRRNPTPEEVYDWCEGGGSGGESILFGVASVSELESGSSASTYLVFLCMASNDQPVNACIILDYATAKGIYFMTSDGKFPDDPETREQLATYYGITKLGWQIDGVYTKASFSLKDDDPAYFVAINSYYDRWKDYFSTTPFPDPWINNQLYEIVEDDSIKAKPIYILESLDADISADNVLLGYQGYNDKGELITGTAYNDLSAYFLLKPDEDSFFSRILIDTNRIKADPKFANFNYLSLGNYALSDLDNIYDIIIAKDVTSIASNCFAHSACIINWEDSDRNLSLSSEAFSNYNFNSGMLFYMPERITSIGADCFKDSYKGYGSAICISNLNKWLNIQFENEYSNPMYCMCDLYLASEPLTDVANNPDASVSGTSIPKLTTLDLSNTNLTTINKWVMTGCQSLTEIKLPASIISIGDGAFKNCQYVDRFDFSRLNLQSIGKEAFFMFGHGGERIFDFRNSSFTTIEEKTFGCVQGYASGKFIFYSPPFLVEIKDNNFQYINEGDFYLSSQDVVKIGTGLWENSNNYKIYVPYTLIDRYRSDVSWLDFADNIYGYAPANTFEVGTTLPTESSVDNYTLKWYTENTLVNQVTTVTDPSAVLYCSISKYKKYYTLKNIVSTNCSPYLTDGVTNYHLGDKIPSEKELTLVINPSSQNYVPYICYVNHENYLGSTKITITSDVELFISCTDGLDFPVSTNISNMNWDNIRQVCLNNLASNLWKVGDIKTVTSKSGNTYNIRLCDLQDGRYEYADGSGRSKAVFEFVDLYKLNGEYIDAGIGTSNGNVGGWRDSNIRATIIPQIINDLPDDLVSAISEVKVLCSIGGRDNYNQQVNSSNDKLFLPAEIELFSKKHYSIGLPESPLGQFDYYKANNTSEARIKSNKTYWERSPESTYDNSFCMVYFDGSYGNNNIYNTNGVALIFAI